MWHFTDVFYHTDGDRLDMVSAEEMKNVGVSALATAFILCSADEQTIFLLIDEIKISALERLSVEFELGRVAILSGSKPAGEQHILEVWASWYVQALDKMMDIHVGPSTERINQKIKDAQREVQQKSEDIIEKLKP